MKMLANLFLSSLVLLFHIQLLILYIIYKYKILIIENNTSINPFKLDKRLILISASLSLIKFKKIGKIMSVVRFFPKIGDTFRSVFANAPRTYEW